MGKFQHASSLYHIRVDSGKTHCFHSTNRDILIKVLIERNIYQQYHSYSSYFFIQYCDDCSVRRFGTTYVPGYIFSIFRLRLVISTSELEGFLRELSMLSEKLRHFSTIRSKGPISTS